MPSMQPQRTMDQWRGTPDASGGRDTRSASTGSMSVGSAGGSRARRASASVAWSGLSMARDISTACHSISMRLRAEPTMPITCTRRMMSAHPCVTLLSDSCGRQRSRRSMTILCWWMTSHSSCALTVQVLLVRIYDGKDVIVILSARG